MKNLLYIASRERGVNSQICESLIDYINILKARYEVSKSSVEYQRFKSEFSKITRNKQELLFLLDIRCINGTYLAVSCDRGKKGLVSVHYMTTEISLDGAFILKECSTVINDLPVELLGITLETQVFATA